MILVLGFLLALASAEKEVEVGLSCANDATCKRVDTYYTCTGGQCVDGGRDQCKNTGGRAYATGDFRQKNTARPFERNMVGELVEGGFLFSYTDGPYRKMVLTSFLGREVKAGYIMRFAPASQWKNWRYWTMYDGFYYIENFKRTCGSKSYWKDSYKCSMGLGPYAWLDRGNQLSEDQCKNKGSYGYAFAPSSGQCYTYTTAVPRDWTVIASADWTTCVPKTGAEAALTMVSGESTAWSQVTIIDAFALVGLCATLFGAFRYYTQK